MRVAFTVTRRTPHPVIWTILYIPFGALGGFVSVALTFLATRSGLSITEGAMLSGASLVSQWLKWTWAPLVDITLTPKRWYVLSTALSALGIVLMASLPLSPSTLGTLLAVIAVASLVNSVVGMSVEALIAASTQPDEIGRVSAWFQAGNLGGAGVGGGLGLLLLQKLPKPWMSGAILGAIFMACCLALLALPALKPHPRTASAMGAVREVFLSILKMLRTRGGLLSAVLCALPIGTGAASGVLTQAAVAARWHAGAGEVALLQGFVAGIITAVGCFAGGWLCQRTTPRTAYAVIGLALAAIAAAMAVTPYTVTLYVVWNLLYSFAVGLAYAAFTAVVLTAMGEGSAATKYNFMASLSNFPIWWLGLALGRVADRFGPRAMLLTEAGFGVLGVGIFMATASRVRRSALPA